MQHKLTIVSAFISGVNRNPTKSIDQYLQLGPKLLRLCL